MFPKTRELKHKKCDNSAQIFVFYHKLPNKIVILGVFKARLVTFGKFLLTVGHEKCLICNKLEYAPKLCKLWSKMFPSHPKCSPSSACGACGFSQLCLS